MNIHPLYARLGSVATAPARSAAVLWMSSAHAARPSLHQTCRSYATSRSNGGGDRDGAQGGQGQAPSSSSSSSWAAGGMSGGGGGGAFTGGPSPSSFDDLPTPPRQPSSSSDAMRAHEVPPQPPHTPSLRVPFPPSGLDLPESTFLKCIEKEMMDEKYRLDKEAGSPPVPAGWEFHHPPGTSLIYGRCIWQPAEPIAVVDASTAQTENGASTTTAAPPKRRATEQHYVRIQLTTRDASLDPECDIRGEHFPFSFFVKHVPETPAEPTTTTTTTGDGPRAVAKVDQPAEAFTVEAAWVRDLDGRAGVAPSDGSAASPLYQDSIEVRCDVIDGELVVDHVVYHGAFRIYGHAARRAAVEAAASGAEGEVAVYDNPFGGYAGPNLDEAEEEILDGIQAWLAERRIDDLFGEFVGQYSIWVEQAEYEQWLQQLHDYVAA